MGLAYFYSYDFKVLGDNGNTEANRGGRENARTARDGNV